MLTEKRTTPEYHFQPMSTRPSHWTPVLEGALRQKAEQTIGQISDAIARQFVPVPEPINGLGWAGLASGVAGWALLFRYRALAQEGEAAAASSRLSAEALAQGLGLLESVPLSASLY